MQATAQAASRSDPCRAIAASIRSQTTGAPHWRNLASMAGLLKPREAWGCHSFQTSLCYVCAALTASAGPIPLCWSNYWLDHMEPSLALRWDFICAVPATAILERIS